MALPCYELHFPDPKNRLAAGKGLTGSRDGLVTGNEVAGGVIIALVGGACVGVTKFSVVMVFHTREKFDEFVAEGWDFSGEVEASAKTSDKGGTAGGADSFGNVSVYQFTEKGLALEATLSGTRYWQNDKLN